MIPLHHDRHFTFRFGGDRIIPRFHLDGVAAGVRVSVFRFDAATETLRGLARPRSDGLRYTGGPSSSVPLPA